MPVPKGTRPPAAGNGRPRGAKNKLTRDVKAMILAALDGVGGQAYLEEQAVKNPVAFLTLLGKLLPMTLQGGSSEPLTIKIVHYAPKEELTTGASFLSDGLGRRSLLPSPRAATSLSRQ